MRRVSSLVLVLAAAALPAQAGPHDQPGGVRI